MKLLYVVPKNNRLSSIHNQAHKGPLEEAQTGPWRGRGKLNKREKGNKGGGRQTERKGEKKRGRKKENGTPAPLIHDFV